MSAVEIAASLTMRADVADDMVVTWQLQTGWTAQQILVAHYDGLLRRRVGSEGDRASWREAREFVAEPKFMEFIKDVVNTTGAKLIDLVKLFKDSRVVKFFGKVGWSFKAIFALLKDGLKAYQTLQKAIGEYVANTRVGRWTTEELKKLDEWLKSHPRTKKLAGVAVGALLIYFWFNQSFIGDPAFDFDMSYILDALAGKFDLASLFGGPSGMALLLAIAIGFATGASFPWPGPGTV